MREKLSSATSIETDNDYASFERLIAARVADATGPLFTTDAEKLFDAYLAGIPEPARQHYRCAACRRFLERYGGLVKIADDGCTEAVLWGLADVPPFFRDSVI